MDKIGISAELVSITINRADGTTEYIEVSNSEGEENGDNNEDSK